MNFRLTLVAVLLAAQSSVFAWTAQVLNTSTAAEARFDSSLSLAAVNTIMVAAWCSNTTVGVDFDVRYSHSTDAGASWSAPAVLNTKTPGNTGMEDGVVVVPAPPGATWITAWSSEDPLNNTISDDKDILFSRSTNSAGSWAATAAVNTDAPSDAFQDYNPTVAGNGTGTWVAAWESYAFGPADPSDGDDDIRFARSTNNAATWGAPAFLNTNATSDLRADQNVQIATNRTGNWLAVWQSTMMPNSPVPDGLGNDSDLFFSRSTDNGSTWTSPVVLNVNAASDSGNDFDPQIASSGATWITVWSSNDTLGGSTGADDDIVFSRWTDAGTTWSAPAALNSNASIDTGHDASPSITWAANKFFVVWHATNVFSGDQEILMAYSSNDGVSWSAPEVVNTNAAADTTHDLTPQIAVSATGATMAAWRTMLMDHNDGDMLYARTTFGPANAVDWELLY